MAAFVEQAQVNDIGTVFRVTVYDTTNTGATNAANISDASSIVFYFRTPADTVVERNGSFTNSGTDGQVQYVTVDGDLSMAGTWSLQVKIATPSGTWRTNKANFKVNSNIE